MISYYSISIHSDHSLGSTPIEPQSQEESYHYILTPLICTRRMIFSPNSILDQRQLAAPSSEESEWAVGRVWGRSGFEDLEYFDDEERIADYFLVF